MLNRSQVFAGQASEFFVLGKYYEANKNLLRHQLCVTGTWNSSFGFPGDEDAKQDDWRYVLRLLKEKRIAPAEFITHRYSMENLEKGFRIMRDKSEDYVKVMGVF